MWLPECSSAVSCPVIQFQLLRGIAPTGPGVAMACYFSPKTPDLKWAATSFMTFVPLDGVRGLGQTGV